GPLAPAAPAGRRTPPARAPARRSRTRAAQGRGSRLRPARPRATRARGRSGSARPGASARGASAGSPRVFGEQRPDDRVGAAAVQPDRVALEPLAAEAGAFGEVLRRNVVRVRAQL